MTDTHQSNAPSKTQSIATHDIRFPTLKPYFGGGASPSFALVVGRHWDYRGGDGVNRDTEDREAPQERETADREV